MSIREHLTSWMYGTMVLTLMLSPLILVAQGIGRRLASGGRRRR